MKPYSYRVVGFCALIALFIGVQPALGAWDNVFQVTCLFGNRGSVSSYAPSVAYSVPIVSTPSISMAAPTNCCNPCCPQTQCTTSYVQRCYYEPVTTYKTQTYYEPVTTYQTRYFYEPVTSYRYSCYYDPCTCSYRQVAVPTTSYQLKSQKCPVQSFVQRCAQVPVVSYKKTCCWQPQTTCCTTTSASIPVTVDPCDTPQPLSTDSDKIRPPSIKDNTGNGGLGEYERYYGPPKKENNSNGEPPNFPNTYQPPLKNPEMSIKPRNNIPPPPVKYDRIVSLRDESYQVQGKVIQDDNRPRSNATVMFIPSDSKQGKKFVTANGDGRFNVTLTSGRWLIYMNHPNGQPFLHSQIEVKDQKTTYLTLMSRSK